MLNLQRLAIFEVVMRTGSLSAAARELGYTSAAVSQQIARLERETSLVLFERLPRGIRPTSVARQLSVIAAPLRMEAGAVEGAIDRMVRGISGRLRIGAFPTAFASLVPEAVTRFQRLCPAAELDLVEAHPETLVPAVARDNLDAALTFSYRPTPQTLPRSVMHWRVLVEPLLLLQPSSSAEQDVAPISIDELAPFAETDFVAARAEQAGAACLEYLCAEAGFAPRIRLRSDDYAVVAAYVAAGLGNAVVPALSARHPQPGLRLRPITDVSARRETHFIARSGVRVPLLRAFAQAVNSSAAALTHQRQARALGITHVRLPIDQL